MVTDPDRQDKSQSRAVLLALSVACLLLIAAGLFALPLLNGFIAAHLQPGLGMKDAAVIAFFVTVALLVVLAVAAGDGLLGELQYMLGAFSAQFVILWLLIAWIF